MATGARHGQPNLKTYSSASCRMEEAKALRSLLGDARHHSGRRLNLVEKIDRFADDDSGRVNIAILFGLTVQSAKIGSACGQRLWLGYPVAIEIILQGS